MFYVERDSSVTKSSSWRQTTELNSEWRSEMFFCCYETVY